MRYLIALVSSLWLIIGFVLGIGSKDNFILQIGIVVFLIVWNFIVAFLFSLMDG